MASGKLADIVQGYKKVRNLANPQKPSASPASPAPVSDQKPGKVEPWMGGTPHVGSPRRDLPRPAQAGDSTLISTRAVRGRR